MDEEEIQDETRDCSSCGGTVTAEDLAKGRAFRREGRIFCRRCMRKEFPDECRNHPGVKTEEKCAMCHSPYCSDCLVEISEVKVCEKCKPAVLEMLQKGEDICKPGVLKLSKRPWERRIPESVHEVAEKTLPTNFCIPIAAVVVVLILAFRYVRDDSFFLSMFLLFHLPAIILVAYWFLSSSMQVFQLTINRLGIEADATIGKTKKMPWEAVRSAKLGRGWIVVRGNGPTIKLRRSVFRRHDLIADAIREACRQRDIPCKG